MVLQANLYYSAG